MPLRLPRSRWPRGCAATWWGSPSGRPATAWWGWWCGWRRSARFSDALGYAFIALGTLLLLIGGARGGGYSNLGVGAVEALMGGRNRAHDDYESDEELRRGKVMKKRDPMARLRRGLRPQANPTAFWQVIGRLRSTSR